jgi:hypothetical protein
MVLLRLPLLERGLAAYSGFSRSKYDLGRWVLLYGREPAAARGRTVSLLDSWLAIHFS